MTLNNNTNIAIKNQNKIFVVSKRYKTIFDRVKQLKEMFEFKKSLDFTNSKFLRYNPEFQPPKLYLEEGTNKIVVEYSSNDYINSKEESTKKLRKSLITKNFILNQISEKMLLFLIKNRSELPKKEQLYLYNLYNKKSLKSSLNINRRINKKILLTKRSKYYKPKTVFPRILKYAVYNVYKKRL